MFNLLRADFYRLVRTRYFWVITGLAILTVVGLAVFMNWLACEGDMVPANAKERGTLTHDWGNIMLQSGFLGILGSLLAGMLILMDFKQGYIKNIPMDRRGRWNYFSEKLIIIAILQAYILAVCALATFLSFSLLGFTYAPFDTLDSIVLWLFFAWLYFTTMAIIVACVTWLFKNETVSSLAALFFSGGIMGAVVLQVLTIYPFFPQLPQFLLASVRMELGQGAATLFLSCAGKAFPAMPVWAHALIICLAYSLIASAIIFGICRKRDMN